MGCLLEFIFEIVFEGIIELVGYCYLKLMTLIVPDKMITEKTRNTIKKVVTTFSAVLSIVLIIGLVFLFQDNTVMKSIGAYMTFIPLGIIVLQILAGIVTKIIDAVRK